MNKFYAGTISLLYHLQIFNELNDTSCFLLEHDVQPDKNNRF